MEYICIWCGKKQMLAGPKIKVKGINTFVYPSEECSKCKQVNNVTRNEWEESLTQREYEKDASISTSMTIGHIKVCLSVADRRVVALVYQNEAHEHGFRAFHKFVDYAKTLLGKIPEATLVIIDEDKALKLLGVDN